MAQYDLILVYLWCFLDCDKWIEKVFLDLLFYWIRTNRTLLLVQLYFSSILFSTHLSFLFNNCYN